MHQMKQVVTIVVVMVTALASATLVMADTKLVQAVHTGSVMGQPAKDTTNTVWFAKDRMRMDTDEGSMIVRMDQKKLYVINHGERSYSVVEYPVDLSSLMPPEMAQMMGAMNLSATVTPGEGSKTILGYKAKLYNVTMKSSMMEMKQTVWAAKDFGFDYAAARDMMAAVQSLQPGMADAIKEMSKIEGFQLEMEGSMEIMGNSVSISSKTLSVDESGAPEGGYDPPAGYAEKPFNPMQR